MLSVEARLASVVAGWEAGPPNAPVPPVRRALTAPPATVYDRMIDPVKVISLGFRTDLMLRKMAGSLITDSAAHVVVRTPTNPGFWWGNFVLFNAPAQQGDATRWRAAVSDEFPEAPHLALGVDGIDGDAGDTSVLAELGVTTEVNSVLTATRLVPPARQGAEITVRPLTSDGDWAQAMHLRFACHAVGTASADQRIHREKAGRRPQALRCRPWHLVRRVRRRRSALRRRSVPRRQWDSAFPDCRDSSRLPTARARFVPRPPHRVLGAAQAGCPDPCHRR